MALETVYLIRHGETEWNIIGRWQGILDVQLNKVGREQAQKLAEEAKNTGIEAIYSSDLSRAAETAQALAAPLGLTPILDTRLRELHIGVFQGLKEAEIKQKYPEEFAAFLANPLEYRIPEGESRMDLQARVFALWKELLSSSQHQTIALVSHNGTLKMLLSALFPEKTDFFQSHSIPNATLNVLKRLENTWQLEILSESSKTQSKAGYF
jgi:broad specificity phosphatase PhoE